MTSEQLKIVFFNLCGTYTSQSGLMEECWLEIEASYSSRNRYYHTLSHLQNVMDELTASQQDISDWHVMQFSVYYHDIVYNALKNNNEEKSAALAESRMQSLQVPTEKITKAKLLILATKGHHVSSDPEINIFTDADLAVLGKPWNVYSEYARQIRKEYSVYPDLIYNPGRKKVLNHFLSMERIYKTDLFFQRYETKSRSNMEKELKELSK
jgi:predicted metal-dependent HD superfamily phosphohydrolase